MDWSPSQQAIFAFVASGKGHGIVSACPGAGKTTTIVQALRSVPVGASVLFLAFNSKIVKELKSRIPAGVDAATCNSYGNRSVIRSVNGRAPRVAGGTGERVKRNLSRFFPEDFPADGYKLADLAKARLAVSDEDFAAIVSEFELDTEKMEVPDFVTLTKAAIKRALEDASMIDFADQIWLPVFLDLPQKQYDFVFIDEAQDFTPAMVELALRACKENGRIIAVGDPLQAISTFRGATLTALEDLGARLSATWLTLPVSYRCAKAIVSEAQSISTVIQPSETAIEGTVARIGKDAMLRDVKAGDFIISRVNAPLVSLCFAFLAQGRRCAIQGRDIGESLIALAKKIGKLKKVADVPSFLTALGDYHERESAKLLAAKRETEGLDDKVSCLEVIATACDSLSEIQSRIENLFTDTDDATRIVLTSAHRSKGLERERVFLLEGTFRPGSKEEDNILYVGITRAKRELYYVDGFKKKREPMAA